MEESHKSMNQWIMNVVSSRMMIRLFEQLTAPVCEQYGLTRAETDVLAFLTNNPGMDTARDIVEYRQMSKAGVSQAVEQLIQKGLLSRSQDEKDRRQIHLRLTETAQPAAAALAAARRTFDEVLLKDFTDEEKALYLKLTAKTQQNAKQAMERN